MPPAPSPTVPRPIATLPVGCGQAVVGLVLGGAAALAMVAADPFGVTALELPQGVDLAEQRAAYDRWRGSAGVLVGSAAMTLIPLLISGACGVFLHRSLPSSIPAKLLRLAGVASLLLLVSTVGSWAIDRALSTGESSDILAPLVVLAFQAAWICLAAPLASAVIRRRSRVGSDRSHGPIEATPKPPDA